MTDPTLTDHLSDRDRRVVDAALSRMDAEASPNRLRILGWFLALMGALLLSLTPAVGRYIDIGREAAVVLAFVGAAILIAGAGAVLLSGYYIKAKPAQRAAEQIRRLTSGTLSEDEILDASVRLLVNARLGQDTGTTFDVREVSGLLGERASDVRRVERDLVERGRILPVFTAATGTSTAI